MSGQVRLVADREVCIGAGLCVLADDKVFDQDDEGLVVVVDERSTGGEGVKKALRNCPSGALRFAEE